MFHHRRKKKAILEAEEEMAKELRWMGTFSHPDVEIDPDNRSTVNSKFVRILSDIGAAAFFTAFVEPKNSAGVQELTVLGDNPLKGVATTLTTAGYQLIGSAVASIPTLTLFKLSGLCFILVFLYFALGHVLYVCVYFADVKLTIETVMSLVNGLRESKSLNTVILWKCRLDDFMASHAVEVLLQIPTIRTINLGQNVLTADGKTYLENNAKAINPYIDLRMF